MIKLSFLDKVLNEIDTFVKLTKAPLHPTIESPAKSIVDSKLSESDRKHSAGLIRVDYTGEVCAQGLYRGQAVVAKSAETKAHLYPSAESRGPSGHR